MANVKLRIEINSDASNEALGQISTDNMEFANTSIQPNADGVFSAFPKLSNATSGINSLTYGQELCFNDSDVLDNIDGFGAGLDDEENPVEVVWGIVNEDKTYNVTLTFTGATGLQNVIVYGDKESKQFPTRAILDGTKEVFSDDYIWSIKFNESNDTHTIQFTHWNRANYNAVLTLIDVMLQNYEVDIYNGLKSVESLSQSSSDTSTIFYGSIENSGSVEMLDKNGELGDLLSDGIIDNSNVPIKVLVNGKEVQNHTSTDSSYDRNSKTLSIELGNRLNSLDILKYKGYTYPDHSENLANLLFDVLSNLRYALFGEDRQLTEDEFKEMLSDKYNSNITLYDYLNSIEVQYPVIESNRTYREVIDEFCLIAQMQMYIDDDNNVKFVTARPKEFTDELNAIHIPKKNMFSQLDYAVIIKNKYNGVEASKTEINDLIDYNTPIFTSEKITSFGFKINDEVPDLELLNDSNYNTITQLGLFVFIRNYYYEADITIPIKQNDNLQQILKILTSLTTTDENGNVLPRYSLKFKKYATDGSFYYTFDSNKFITGYTGLYYPFQIEEEKADRINPLIDGLNVVIRDEDYSEKLSITKDDINGVYQAHIKILVGQQKSFSQSNEGSNEAYLEVSIPESLEYSIYGDKRTISFKTIQSNTTNIETAKTKVSLNSSTLIQTDAVIDTIKNNILADYIQGVSNASVSISCNDYFDNNGRKVINWEKGEIPQVNQVVYFDNDLYKDQSQRYWKIKGRNFRKTGVPMVDLELEELINKPMESYSWNEIDKIINSDLAQSVFSIGDTKSFTLSTGETLVAEIVNFKGENKSDGSGEVGAVLALKYPMKDLYVLDDFRDEHVTYSWQACTMKKYTLPSILESMPQDLQNAIKEINRDTEYERYGNDKLYCMNYDRTIGLSKPYTRYKNKENLKKGVSWWLGEEVNNSGIVTTDAQYQRESVGNKHALIFAFCI